MKDPTFGPKLSTIRSFYEHPAQRQHKLKVRFVHCPLSVRSSRSSSWVSAHRLVREPPRPELRPALGVPVLVAALAFYFRGAAFEALRLCLCRPRLVRGAGRWVCRNWRRMRFPWRRAVVSWNRAARNLPGAKGLVAAALVFGFPRAAPERVLLDSSRCSASGFTPNKSRATIESQIGPCLKHLGAAARRWKRACE